MAYFSHKTSKQNRTKITLIGKNRFCNWLGAYSFKIIYAKAVSVYLI